jgi:hypothetical protein
MQHPQQMRPNGNSLRLLGRTGELLVSIDSGSWHVLDEPDLFPEGAQLRKAFGVTWASGMFQEPPHGILQHLPTRQFRQMCETGWQSLLRDQALLSHSYTCQYVSPEGERQDASRAAYTVRGFRPALNVRPKGYCKLRLFDDSGFRPGRIAEIIDLRTAGKLATDDGGYLTIRRRSMSVDWYREMPRILDFCDQNNTDWIEVRLHGD